MRLSENMKLNLAVEIITARYFSICCISLQKKMLLIASLCEGKNIVLCGNGEEYSFYEEDALSMVHEDDRWKIPEEIKTMSVAEIREEKEKMLKSIPAREKDELSEKLARCLMIFYWGMEM